jgi:Tol biopolymer transport system component/DNA-binding winged helix-turn-helix (wHTH) protein
MEHKAPDFSHLPTPREVTRKTQAPFLAGDWLVEPEFNSLRRGSVERHLEPKVMKVLLALAEQPNHVISKDDLISAVWPGTFVSDDVLTRCISMLRRATSDDPTKPQFIQTIPKAGYCLVAEIQPVPRANDSAPTAPDATWAVPESVPTTDEKKIAEEVATAPAEETTLPIRARSIGDRDKRVLGLWFGFVTLIIVIIGTGIFLLLRTSRSQQHETVLRTLPFTSEAGEQLQPAFSPDGGSLAYVAVSTDGRSQHLLVKKVGTEQSQQITNGSGEDYSPAWSPDGRSIAYLSHNQDGLGLFVMDLASHSVRKIYVPEQMTHWEQGALSWSPDSRSLVFPDHAGSSPSSSIFLLDLATLQTRALTHAPDGWEGDLTPAFSPDGRRIAFTRASETAVRDLFWVAAEGGEVHALTHDRTNIDSLAWDVDADSIIFSSNRGGKSALWRVALKDPNPKRMPMGTEDASQPAVSRVGNALRVAYVQGSAVWGIVEVAAGSNAEPRSIISSTQQDSAPSLSPDGRRFAFQSQRSGFQEIWTANVDGTDLQQITHQGGPLTGSPAWGHRGDQMLFDSRINGHSHIFCFTAAGRAVQLTSGDFNDITPHWSNDDAMIFFRSNRGGRWQLWRMSMQERQPTPLTSDDGIVPQPSTDGRWVYYTRGGEGGVWRVPVNGGSETQILSQPAAGYWGFWEVTPQGIVYLDVTEKSLRIYDPARGKSDLFARLQRMPPEFAGLTVTPDGRRALLTDEAQAGRHITLADVSRDSR